MIQTIFEKNHPKYGYPQITMKLKYRVNKNKFRRLIKAMNMRLMPKRNMHKSYRGTIVKIADNALNKTLSTSRINEKFWSDTTQFTNLLPLVNVIFLK